MQKVSPHNFKGFTLVELIVVITIVGILSTVGFVSYSSYLTGARDSNRMSQLTKISDSLQTYSATKSLPLPDDAINIEANAEKIGYQGKLGVDVLETIDYTNGGKDPKDDSYFSYYLTKNRDKIQLLALMEEEKTLGYNDTGTNIGIGQGFADFEGRYPKVYGQKLGILTQILTNIPVQEITAVQTAGSIDIVDTDDRYAAHVSDAIVIEGTGATLRQSIPNASCNRIKQTGGAKRGNALYTINPAGAGNIQVYCNMEIAGGGWTLIGRSVVEGAGTFNFTSSRGSVKDDTDVYTLNAANIPHSEGILAAYTRKKVVDSYEVLSDISSSSLTASGITTGTLGGQQGMLFVK